MHILSLLVGFLVFSLSSKAESIFSCWDASYNMKYASLIESENRLELSLKGSNLGDLKFSHYLGEITFSPWVSQKVFIQFSKDQCFVDKANQSGHCEKSANILWDAFFVERTIDNLGELINPITSLPGTKVTLDYTPENIKVEFHGSYYPDSGRDVQTIEFDFKQCYDPDSYAIEFPQPLKNYLDKWYP